MFLTLFSLVVKNCSNCMSCHTCLSQPDIPLPPLRLCLQLPSGLHLFSLSFCCLENNAFSCRFSEQILSQLSFLALRSLSSMSCPVYTVAACTRVQHTMCFAGCVYTEVALSLTCSSMWPLERLVHVTSDFHCEWAIVAMQTMASTDEPFRHGVAPIALVSEQIGPQVVSVFAVAIKEVRRFVPSR